jgi:hypothetical protein
MRTLRFVSALIAAAACSTGPGPDVTATPTTTRISLGSSGGVDIRGSSEQVAITSDLPISSDSALGLLRAAYADLQLGAARVDVAARTVTVSAAKIRRRLGGVALTRYLDCGAKYNIPNAETYDVQVTVTSQVTAVGEGRSRLSTNVQAAASDPFQPASNQVVCTTLSTLEARISDGVRQRAGLPVARK